MRKIRIISFILVLAVILCFISACSDGETDNNPVYIRVDKNGDPDEKGQYIVFGEYPQTLKAENVTVSEKKDERGYYLGSDGEYYAKVTAKPFDDLKGGYTFSDNSKIEKGAVYYFKVEPLRWRILSENNGKLFLLCETVIINKAFDAESNNYAESDIRAWLNGELYSLMFNEAQKKIILTSSVDNGADTTVNAQNQYACEDTEDKLFFLSYEDVKGIMKIEHGIEFLQLQASDHAKANGAWISKDEGYKGNAIWWMRSPFPTSADTVCYVNYNVEPYVTVSFDNLVGVAPAMQINIGNK